MLPEGLSCIDPLDVANELTNVSTSRVIESSRLLLLFNLLSKVNSRQELWGLYLLCINLLLQVL